MPHSVDDKTFFHDDSPIMTDTEYTHIHLANSHPLTERRTHSATVQSFDPSPCEDGTEGWTLVDATFESSEEVSDHLMTGSTSSDLLDKSNYPWIDNRKASPADGQELTLFDCPVVLNGGCSCACRSLLSKFNDLGRSHFTSESLHLSRQSHLLEFTGDWLLHSCRFKEWVETDATPLMWLHGLPGAGKSMLASVVVNHLATNIRSGDVVTYYFNDGRFKNSSLARSILWEMLLGLLFQNEAGESRDQLESLSTNLHSVGHRMSLSQMKYFFSAIRHSLKSHQTLWLILDGLDDGEDYQTEPDDVLVALLRLVTTLDSTHRIKCFLSSRPDLLPRDMRRYSVRMDLDGEACARVDLKRYVNQQTQSLPLFQRFQCLNLVEELVSRANGLFLWVNLVVQELHSNLSVLLEKLRSSRIDGLSGIYCYLLDKIPAESHSTALLMLSWVVSAARPLHLKELGNLLKMDAEVTATDVARISGGLLTTHTGQTVSLVHLSARQFLSLPWNSHEIIAGTCLKSLRPQELAHTLGFSVSDEMCSHSTGLDEQSFTNPYFRHYWIFHYMLAEPQSDYLPGLLHSRLKSGFENESFKALGQERAGVPPTRCKVSFTSPQQLRHQLISNVALTAAARHGFVKSARLELQLGATQHLASQPGTNTALHVAVKRGHLEIVKVLLQYGSDVHQTSKTGLTPLHLAVASGNSMMVDLLWNRSCLPSTRTLQASSCWQKCSCTNPAYWGSCKHAPLDAFQTLSLAISTSIACSECDQMAVEYIISPLDADLTSFPVRTSDPWRPIHVTGETISAADASVCSILGQAKKCSPKKSRTRLASGPSPASSNETTFLRWFPGVSMFQALRIASKRGMGDVRDLLLAAGNDASVIDSFISLDNLVKGLSIS